MKTKASLLLLTVIMASGQLLAANSAAKPNILVIFTDDHGGADLGAQGVRKDIRTPHIDALASGGLRAVSGYATAPHDPAAGTGK